MITGLTLQAICQDRIVIPKCLRDVVVTREHSSAITGNEEVNGATLPENRTGDFLQTEDQIGTTWYDLQSNAALANRITLFDDGTIGAVWTMGHSATLFPDRGTGYNYFDGSSWGPVSTTRIESDRCGWPSIAPYGTYGEIIVSHISGGAGTGLLFNHRSVKGTGTWTEFSFQGPAGGWEQIWWPRMITSGTNHDVIHLLTPTMPTGNGGTPYNGMDPALLYSRSTDDGVTWDPLHAQLPGTTSSEYTGINADEYVWAEPRGNTIAFCVVDLWKDLFIMKSNDGGDSWTKTIVWQHPYPFFDFNTTITTDTLWAPDKSADIAIDENGMVHLVVGLSRVAHFEVGTTYQFWPYTDGIAYWNENRPPFTAPNQHDALDAWDVLIPDYNLIAWEIDVDNSGTIDLLQDIMTYRSLSLTTMPNITVTPDNQLIVCFAMTTEGYDNGTYNYKHVWVRGSNDNGTTWLDFYDLNTDLIHIFDECIYPVMAGNTDDAFHLIYNIDADPGVAIDNDHAYQENRIYYSRMLLEDIGLSPSGTGINTFPYTESYENGLGAWQQSQNDDFDWTVNQGPTPSSGTGPSAAYDGNYYLYTESSDPNSPNKIAGLFARFNFTQLDNPVLSFWYHMFGSNMGTLTVQASTDNGSTWNDLWTLSGDQGDQWYNAVVNLSQYALNPDVTLRFWGLTGSGYRSDMAIDLIEVFNAATPTCITPVYPPNEEMDVPVNTDLTWNASPLATGYLIWFGRDNPPTNIENGTDLGDVLSYTPVSLLDYNTDYFWKVVPYNQYGQATSCPTWAFTTQSYSFDLNVKVFLEGPYLGPYMTTILNIIGFVPLAQPYNSAPWYYTGTEAVQEIPNNDVVEWVLVELRDAPTASMATSATMIARKAAFVMKNGLVRDLDGTSLLQFDVPIINNLFVVIWHRNHLSVMSAMPLAETGGVYSYDFSDAATKAYGASLAHTQIGSGIWGMTGGDGTSDGQVSNNDKIEVWIPQSGNSGYLTGDFTLDGQVNNTDKVDVWVPNGGNGSQVPN